MLPLGFEPFALPLNMKLMLPFSLTVLFFDGFTKIVEFPAVVKTSLAVIVVSPLNVIFPLFDAIAP